MAAFGRSGVDLDPQAIQLLETLQRSTNDPGVQNIIDRIGSGEFGGGLLSLQDVIGIGRRLLPGQFDLLTQQASGSQAGGDLNTMSDADLLAEAGRLGIDTAQFNVPASQLEGGLQDLSALNVERGPVELSPDIRSEVSAIFEPQRQQFLEELRRNTVELAGQRGLSIGDADIPQRVAERLSTGLAGFRGQEAQTLLSLAESARANRLQQLGLREQGLLGRSNLLENRRQFENQFGLQQQQANRQFLQSAAQFQNQLRQQAFLNRQAISGQSGQIGLGLAGARFGVPTGQSNFDPTASFLQNQVGTGLIGAGIRNIGQFVGF